MWMLILGPILIGIGIIAVSSFFIGPCIVYVLKISVIQTKNFFVEIKKIWKSEE